MKATWLIIAVSCVVLAGCSWFMDSVGHEGQPCTQGGLCVDGSTCQAGRCVDSQGTDGDSTDSDPFETDLADGDGTETTDGDGAEAHEGQDAETDEYDGEPETEMADGDLESADPDTADPNTWIDPATGLEWQLVPTGGALVGVVAEQHCQELTLSGKRWRLPNISELRSLVRKCAPIATGGACGVKDVCPGCGVAAGEACVEQSCWVDADCRPTSCPKVSGKIDCYMAQELEGDCSWYWSSSIVTEDHSKIWYVSFAYGDVDNTTLSYNVPVRCVRAEDADGDTTDGEAGEVEMEEVDGDSDSDSYCNSQASFACYGNDVYWYDCHGTAVALKEVCGPRGCSAGACNASSYSCANGICLDTATGFEWQMAPTDNQTWASAISLCQNLDLGGTGWRLPNISELRSLIRNCDSLAPTGACEAKDECAACGVGTEDVCLGMTCRTEQTCNPTSCQSSYGCFWPSQMTDTAHCGYYWSASSYSDDSNMAWFVNFGEGTINATFKDAGYFVRCMRDTTPGFVRIKAGTFSMGSPEGELGRDANEGQHSVTLTYDFEMSSYETTQDEFNLLMGYNPSHFTTCGASCPVETVNWHEACAYANALSAHKGYAQCFDCTGSGTSISCSLKELYAKPQDCPGYRLPTEAEWEYAARAGTSAATYNGELTYTDCTSDSVLDPIAWYCFNADAKTHPVGEKTPNVWGLYDMLGNVMEWSWDWQGSAVSSAVNDPAGPLSGTGRVNRGGSWSYDARGARSAFRSGNIPSYYSYNLGFRPVRTLNPPTPGFTHIRKGVFTMGSPEGELGRESYETQHQVALTCNFELATHETTQGEFTTFMGYNPSHFTTCGTSCPVEQVKWHEACAYANAVSAKYGFVECYDCTGRGSSVSCALKAGFSKPQDCSGFRLPTEAEWEYAARAGTTTATYNGDLTYDDCTNDPALGPIAWHCGNDNTTTKPVGDKTPNAWGLYDMLGNVWEWCGDWYGDYPGGTVWDPFGAASGTARVYRGGSWSFSAKYSRAASRGQTAPESVSSILGFRLCRSLP